MLLFSLGSIAVVIIAVLSVSLGACLRWRLRVGHRRISGFDPLLGYGIASLLTLLLFRATGSLLTAASLPLCLGAVSCFWIWRRPWREVLPLPTARTFIVAGSFLGALIAVYLPMALGAGSWFAPPNLYDAPKHILAIASVADSASWPPRNPFYPNEVFTYNFLFYVVPAAAARLLNLPELSFVLFPFMTVLTSACVIWLTVELGNQLGVPEDKNWLVALFATWIGGFTSLIVTGTPALGYLLSLEGWVTHQIWVDEPFVSAIFVPQHIFAASGFLGYLWVFLSDGRFESKMILSTIFAAACSLASFILLPHSAILIAIVSLLFAISYQHLKRVIGVMAACGLAYSLIVTPFLIDAVDWQRGTGGDSIVMPMLDRTLPILSLAFGPVLFFALAGVALLIRKNGPNSANMSILISGIVIFVLAISLRYSEPSFKSTLLLRMMLPALAALGVIWVWGRGSAIVRIGTAGLLIFSIILSAPIISFFAKSSWNELSTSDRQFIQRLRTSSLPILLDGADQWIAALAARPLLMDFRPYRRDAYLPPEARVPYASLFDSLQSNDDQVVRNLESSVGYVIAAPERSKLWRARFGAPVAGGLGLLMFEAAKMPSVESVKH